ncbi:MAG: hypothetical protein M1829_005195 [Trizodia sp. TS-e1964]|nr:MAG: hypothetical protein M1829_005195 [Trizodia sp. TS-e1964]
MAEDKKWASRYLLDPLTAPEPSQETGPGTHYRSTFAPVPVDSPTPSVASLTPRKIVSPRRPREESRQDSPSAPKRTSVSASPRKSPGFSRDTKPQTKRGGDAERVAGPSPSASYRPIHRRGNSLGERFEGDQSHRPLDMLKRDAKLANRAPHLRRKQIPGPDTIDNLDSPVGGPYHHGGPYDVTLLARNIEFMSSPVAAVKDSNNEALRATPKEYIIDAIEKHKPLDGVAVIPPGVPDRLGRTLNYEEGTDLMIEVGNYKRWPGVEYLPEDLKGKGEPSYSIEKALKEKERSLTGRRRGFSEGNSSFELTSLRVAESSNGAVERRQHGPPSSYKEWERQMSRSNSTGKKVGESLKRRFGSLRRKQVQAG